MCATWQIGQAACEPGVSVCHSQMPEAMSTTAAHAATRTATRNQHNDLRRTPIGPSRYIRPPEAGRAAQPPNSKSAVVPIESMDEAGSIRRCPKTPNLNGVVNEGLTTRVVHEGENQVLQWRSGTPAHPPVQTAPRLSAQPPRWAQCQARSACAQHGRSGRKLRNREYPCAKTRRQSPRAKGPSRPPRMSRGPGTFHGEWPYRTSAFNSEGSDQIPRTRWYHRSQEPQSCLPANVGSR